MADELIVMAGGAVLIVYFFAILIAAHVEGVKIPNVSEFV